MLWLSQDEILAGCSYARTYLMSQLAKTHLSLLRKASMHCLFHSSPGICGMLYISRLFSSSLNTAPCIGVPNLVFQMLAGMLKGPSGPSTGFQMGGYFLEQSGPI